MTEVVAETGSIQPCVHSRAVGFLQRLGPNRNERGYTLVELLVVVAILGLLTLIATPFVLGYLDRTKVSTAKTEIANISAGLDLFKLDVGRYPTTAEGLD